ncbi:MAG: hypothetical protein E5Y88_11555 [Mesorhizobium sp.]|uniref:hypothetical protein n=1 Tax=Mesorhizobium sp. TaxID=1871066 RepID=UPI00122975EC|nr:hypothetical protein [Mesorhizobium sp.]TIL25588.1 MAG: hypothetical protein E5Y88_11555 [Mesorhizobium sp.]
MMPGILAQRAAPKQGTPAWVPDGATDFLDFINGQYFSAGAERNILTLLGGDFDPSAISGSGMYVNFDNSNRPTAIGPLLSDLLTGLVAGMTILFEVTTGHSELGGFLLYIGDNESYFDSDAWNVVEANGGVWDEGVLDISTSISGVGAHKIAVTFNRDIGGGNHQYAWSHDGNAAVTQDTPYAASTMTDAQLGWPGPPGGGLQLFQTYIRSITVYPAKLPADLPALTGI